MATKVTLKNVRASFVHVFEPVALAEGQEPKYSMLCLMDENDPQVKKLKEAIAAEARTKFPKKVSGLDLVGLRSPLRDGAEKDAPEYEGCVFFNCSSRNRPQVFDRKKQQVVKEDELIYSGCYVNVSLNLYAYDNAGNRGVGVGLNGLQFHADGERLDGYTDCSSDFDEEETENESMFD